MSSLRFDQYFQMAYVTRDMDAALRVFADQFGVKHFSRTQDLEVNLDDGGTARFHLALAYVGAMQLEIIQPLGGDVDVFVRSLPAEGSPMAMHHVCYDLDSDQELEEVLARHRKSGQEVLFEGRRVGRSRFAYVNTRAQLGYMLEYVSATPEGKKAREAIPRNCESRPARPALQFVATSATASTQPLSLLLFGQQRLTSLGPSVMLVEQNGLFCNDWPVHQGR